MVRKKVGGYKLLPTKDLNILIFWKAIRPPPRIPETQKSTVTTLLDVKT